MKLSTQLLSLCALLITTASFAAPTADLLIVNHSVSALTVNSTYFQAFVLPTEIMPKSTIRIPETATFPLGNVREYIRLEDTADNSTHADEVYFSVGSDGISGYTATCYIDTWKVSHETGSDKEVFELDIYDQLYMKRC